MEAAVKQKKILKKSTSDLEFASIFKEILINYAAFTNLPYIKKKHFLNKFNFCVLREQETYWTFFAQTVQINKKNFLLMHFFLSTFNTNNTYRTFFLACFLKKEHNQKLIVLNKKIINIFMKNELFFHNKKNLYELYSLNTVLDNQRDFRKFLFFERKVLEYSVIDKSFIPYIRYISFPYFRHFFALCLKVNFLFQRKLDRFYEDDKKKTAKLGIKNQYYDPALLWQNLDI